MDNIATAWQYQVYIVFERSVNKYICRVEFGNSEISLSFESNHLSKFLAFNSVLTTGSMKLMDGKIEFDGEFSNILPTVGKFV